MDLNLNNYKVVVTGSSRGIGKAIARYFLEEGANVALTGRDADNLAKTQQELSQQFSGQILGVAGDLSEAAVLHQLTQSLENKWGGIDTLVCNVGSGKVAQHFTESIADWYPQFEINLFSTIKTIKTLWPLLLKETGRGKYEKSIVCISSICGYENLDVPVPVPYAAAKAALNSFVKNVMKPCAEAGIRINVVSPGNIMFPGSNWERHVKQKPDMVAQMLKTEVPLGCFGSAEDIAHVTAFLASKKAGFVTGANWVVDGGQTRS